MKGKVVEVELVGDKQGAVPLDGKMRVGDAVEFMTDMQTEKGPSAGTVQSVSGDKIVIMHSDHPGEEFSKSKLIVKAEHRHRDGIRKLWILK